MGQKRVLDLKFPVGGLNRRLAYQDQPPFTTFDCLNVRPFDPLKGRERGGSRPGLSKAYYNQLGSGNPIRMLAGVTVVLTDPLQMWIDNFEGTAMGSTWSAATAFPGVGAALPSILGELASVSYGSGAGAVRSALTFDTTLPYQVEIYITPYNGAHQGKYSILLKLNDSTPVFSTDGLQVELDITGSAGAYALNVRQYAAGSLTNTYTASGTIGSTAEAGWFSALYTPSTGNLKVYWLGTNILDQNVTLGGAAGNRFGFGLLPTVASGINLVDTFRIQYQTAVNAQVRKRYLVASSNGLLYRDGYVTGMSQVSSNLTLASDRLIHAAEAGQKLYIADNGNPKYIGSADTISGTSVDHSSVSNWTVYSIDTDDDVIVVTNGTGTVTNGVYAISSVASGAITAASSIGIGTATIRIERGPKIYDPVAGTLTLWLASAGLGAVPVGCPLIAFYRNRLVLAGSPAFPHAFLMTRQGNPLDANVGASGSDGGRAISDTSSDVGTVGEPILALIAHSDDYMIFGCQSSLWILRGDPAYGGKLDNLSRNVGVLGRGSWCRGPGGETIILSRDGLYMVQAGSSYPMSLSREVLPQELLNTDTNNFTVLLEYDPYDRGVHIYIVSNDDGRTQNHYWFDWQSKSFWPAQLITTHEPLSIINHSAPAAEDSAVLLGCRDGYIRRYRNGTISSDDGTPFLSHVYYGPLQPGNSAYYDGHVKELIAVPGRDSADIAWTVYCGDTPEDLTTLSATGTFDLESVNLKGRPNLRGCAAFIKLAVSQLGRAWSIDRLTVVLEQRGKQRV